MEIQGKIIVVGELRSGISSRSNQEWKSQDYVIETHDQYPRRCSFNVWGEDKIKQFNIKAGDELLVSFDIDAHEHNGRWYNSIRAWRVVPASASASAAPVDGVPSYQDTASPMSPEAAPGEGTTDDLPF